MKVAVVDDEREMTDRILAFLDRFTAESGISVEREVFHDVSEFVREYGKGKYELLLLDVEMPGMNGIEAARRIREQDDGVVIMFITNMAQYAIHGYEVEAVDYVIKPIGYHDFAMKMKKAIRYIYRDADRQVVLDTSQGKVLVKVSDISYIEVIRHYLSFHTATGIYEVRGVMKEQEEQFSGFHFKRCSQSYLVNLSHVRAVYGNSVMLADGAKLPVSRNRKSAFVDAFARYVGGIE